LGRNKEKERLILVMVHVMKEISWIIICKVMVYVLGLMEINMRENGLIIRCMERVF